MESYQVVDINADSTLVGLRDQKGGNYIARLGMPDLQQGDLIDGGVARSCIQLFLASNCTRIHRLMMLRAICAQLSMPRDMQSDLVAGQAGA